MAMILVDSDILIDGLRGHEPVVANLSRELAAGRLATTVINVFELLSGAKSEVERKKVARLLDALAVFHLSEKASDLAASIRRALESKGEGIGMADYLIAGICLEHSCELWTRNLAHFGRIESLILATMR